VPALFDVAQSRGFNQRMDLLGRGPHRVLVTLNDQDRVIDFGEISAEVVSASDRGKRELGNGRIDHFIVELRCKLKPGAPIEEITRCPGAINFREDLCGIDSVLCRFLPTTLGFDVLGVKTDMNVIRKPFSELQGRSARANENERTDSFGMSRGVSHSEHAAPGVTEEDEPLLLQFQTQCFQIARKLGEREMFRRRVSERGTAGATLVV
jgi:hypothetical protein